MDEESKKLIEIFFTIIFSGTIAYILIFISEPSRIENNSIWFVASCLILGISIWMIYFIFDMKIKEEKVLVARIAFICITILIIFSISRFLYYCNESEDINLIKGSFDNTWYLLIGIGATLLVNGFLDKDKRKEIKRVTIVIFGMVLLLFLFKDALIYGVI